MPASILDRARWPAQSDSLQGRLGILELELMQSLRTRALAQLESRTVWIAAGAIQRAYLLRSPKSTTVYDTRRVAIHGRSSSNPKRNAASRGTAPKLVSWIDVRICNTLTAIPAK